MKKIMILGASYSLVPLIEAAKKLGFLTIAASIPGDYPGFEAADEICYADITKPEEILRAAEKWQVDGIAACMDVGLRSLGYTAEKLGLPGPSWKTVQRCTDKYEMKQAFTDKGVHTAAYCLIRSEEDLKKACEELSFPLILKAVDQMGSRGIFRCDTKDQVFAFYPETMAATGKDYCILEEFLEGTMFGVEAMVQDGRLVYCLPVGNLLHHGNPPFPVGHYVPWETGEAYEEKIEEQVLGAVRALEADNCPMDFDMMLKDGEIYVIEATARAGATCLAEQVGIHFGVNYYEEIVKTAMGQTVSEAFGKKKEDRAPNLVRLLEAEEKGTVEEIRTPQVDSSRVDLSFNIQSGDQVQPMRNGRDRIGQVIISGGSLEECRKELDRVLAGIQVRVRDES